MERLSSLQYRIDDINIGPLLLESGEQLQQVNLRYERVGPKKAPTILVCHALTGSHLAVGHPEEPGWWNGLIGRNKAIDITKYQVITFNVLGGCYGSTGPSSINPDTEECYRMNFPSITIRDMVHAEYSALKQLGIDQLFAVIGGSLGGMQVLEWGLLYPTFMEKLIPLAVTPILSDYGIAYNHIAERAIVADPRWQGGNYSTSEGIQGLEIARMIGMVTYRSATLFAERFGRLHTNEEYSVSSYLNYQGTKLTKRFDANSYLYLLQAMNSHDIGRNRGGWKSAAKQIKSKVLMVSFEHDLIYEPSSIYEFSTLTPGCLYHHVETPFGHDGFLTEYEKWSTVIEEFLSIN